MDAATLQTKIYSGYGKAALRIGYSFDIYRAATAANPIATPNKVGAVLAAFNPGPTAQAFAKAGGHKDAVWNGIFDGTTIDVGDYLKRAGHETYFVVAMQDLQPILCVLCNRTLNIVRPQGPAGLGALGYSGTVAATEQVVMTAWPGNVTYTQKGRSTEAGLPMDLPSPFFTILLPAFPGVIIRTGDVANDDLGQRYTITAAELSALGWRIIAELAVT
jgi:hypothetical protein